MRARRLKHEINVVPYIDVMLVLLVIFMVTAPMVQQGNIELPTVGKMSDPPPGKPLVITVKADGTMEIPDDKLGGAPVTVGRLDLAERIRELKANDPGQAVLIAGDKNARYQVILEVLDEMHHAQVKVSLQVQGK